MVRALGDRARGIALGVFILSFFTIGLAAQDDPPTRVARLNYINGNVSMEPAGLDDWAPAAVNRPFTIGDYLYSDTGAQAELHMDVAVLRLGSQTSIGFLNLDDRTTQIKLAEGDLYVRVRNFSPDQVFEVDTPNGAVTLTQNGRYRFRVDPDGQWSFVVVRDGQAQCTGGGQSFLLDANQSVNISGTDQMSYDVETAPGPDDFDNWAIQRDEREAHLRAAQYVAPTMIGYEDLDDNGDWQQAGEYGAVWYPRQVEAGWAPYHNGHWAWIAPWGWTWVDDQRWGFAPFHYGRWVYVSGRWGWAPGPRVVTARPYYAPALVAWFGGAHLGVSLQIGGGGPALGWVPLGFGEVYTPTYTCSRNYFRDVNVYNTRITNVTVINNAYTTVYVNHTVYNQTFVNTRAPNAVIAMSQSSFASGRPVRTVARPIPAAQITVIATARVVAPPVAPTRQALIPTAVSGRAAPHPPAQLIQRQVVARVAPPAPRPSFEVQQRVLQQHATTGQPVNFAQVRQAAPAVHAAPAVRVVAAAARPVAVRPGARVGSPVVAARPGTVPQPGHVNAAVQPAARNAAANRPAATPAARNAQPTTARPETRPAGTPAARTAQPTNARPETRPAGIPAARTEAKPATAPAARTAQPITARPETRPAGAPAARTTQPTNARPETRPAGMPAARTAQPTTARPETRAATPNRTATPAARPEARPATQPAERTVQPAAHAATPAKPEARPAATPATHGTPPNRPVARTQPTTQTAAPAERKTTAPAAHPERNTKNTRDTKDTKP